MKNIDITNCSINIDKKLIPNRISIALFSYGLNEFYNAFRYLKSILLYVFSKNNLSKDMLKEASLVVSKHYNITHRRIVTAINNFYEMLPSNFFFTSPLYTKIKMNFYHKTQFVAETVLKDIQNYD